MDPNMLITLLNSYWGTMNYRFNFDYEYQHGQALTAQVNRIEAKIDTVVEILQELKDRLDRMEAEK